LLSTKSTKIFTAILGLLAASFLLLAPSASAAIPPLSDTGEYKALQNFVTFLESQAGVETSAGIKDSYQLDLQQRVTAANNRAEVLFDRRKTLARNQVNSNRKKEVRKVRNKERKNLAKAQAVRQKRVREAKQQYRRAAAKIERRYGAKIRSLRKQIANLQRQQNQTRNPRKLAIIEDRLAQARVLIQNNIEDQRSAANKAQRQQRRAIKSARQRYAQISKKIETSADRQAQRLVNKYQQRWEQRLASIQARRSNDLGAVESLEIAGENALEAIPTPPEEPL
jgi:hypothetical protein